MNLLSLFFIFMYIGFCTIGGGLVAISLMQQQLISRGLISSQDFFAMVAVSESTPGPIGINMATYIGYKLYGVLGSVVLTVGIVLPSLITILIIAKFSYSFQNKSLIKKSFYGLRSGAIGMIAVSSWQVLSISIFNFAKFNTTRHLFDIIEIKQFLFFLTALFAVTYLKKLHPIIIVICGAIFGILFL